MRGLAAHATRQPQKLLLLGGTGIIGTAVKTVFSGHYSIVAPDSKLVDVLDPEIVQTIKEQNADVIIYAVAYEPPDETVDAIARAHQINTVVPVRLARLAEQTGAILFTFSSDAIFTGGTEQPYDEYSAPQPDSLYAIGKAATDALLPQIVERQYTIRVSRLFGPSSSGTVRSANAIISAYLAGSNLKLVHDVHKSCTYSIDVAQCMLSLIWQKREFGVYHIANSGKASMFELILEFKKYRKTLAHLQCVSAAQLACVKTPKTSLLASSKLPPLRSWQDAVADYCRHL